MNYNWMGVIAELGSTPKIEFHRTEHQAKVWVSEAIKNGLSVEGLRS